MVTIKQIAQEVGISSSTVSIVLGGKAKLVAGAKPCVAVECKNSSAPLEILTKIFGVQ